MLLLLLLLLLLLMMMIGVVLVIMIGVVDANVLPLMSLTMLVTARMWETLISSLSLSLSLGLGLGLMIRLYVTRRTSGRSRQRALITLRTQPITIMLAARVMATMIVLTNIRAAKISGRHAVTSAGCILKMSLMTTTGAVVEMNPYVTKAQPIIRIFIP